MSACSWTGTKEQPLELRRGRFPCFRTATVVLREVSDSKHFGNPFRERKVCREHADIMIASGWYMEAA